jgi:hypothetical protein
VWGGRGFIGYSRCSGREMAPVTKITLQPFKRISKKSEADVSKKLKASNDRLWYYETALLPNSKNIIFDIKITK